MLILGTLNAYSQQNEDFLKKAKNFHNNYQFSKAISTYNYILENSLDSSTNFIEENLIMSENGKNLLDYSSSPKLVKKEAFSFTDFFLKYPKSSYFTWVKTPKILIENAQRSVQFENGKEVDSLQNANFYNSPFSYMQYLSGSKKMVFCAPCANGFINIFYVEKINDTTWSAPKILNSLGTTNGNEVFPTLSSDGKKLYFSSDGHYGMGGYDLYVSEWDEQNNTWSIAQNLGFPFSSVADDFLFYNTPDKLFSIFSSTRENNGVTVYVVNYESLPLKHKVSEEDALHLSFFEENKNGKTKEKPQAENEEENLYYEATQELRNLRNDLDKNYADLNIKREYLSTASQDSKIKLEEEIALKEKYILEIQQKINDATTRLQEIEMDFLTKGIILSPNSENNTEEDIDEENYFEFEDNTIDPTPIFNVGEPDPLVDLSFKFTKEGYIADLDLFPKNLTYQIQLFSLTKKATTKNLKGASPVFERKNARGLYVYSVGIFETYQKALSNLNFVKKKGFPSAIIVAFENGKQINTKVARTIESKNKEEEVYNVTILGQETLPKEALDIIKNNTTRDIAKTNQDGTPKFIIGPFTSKVEAEKLYNALKSANISLVEIENVEKTK